MKSVESNDSMTKRKRSCHDEGYWEAPPPKSIHPIRSIMKDIDCDFQNFRTLENTFNQLSPTRSIHKKSLSPVQSNNNESFCYERYKLYKARVLQAFHDRKIFQIHGNYSKIRSALLQRGWLEKLNSDVSANLLHLSQDRLLKYANDGNEYENLAISKMLERYPAYFVWQPRMNFDHNDYTMPFRNRIKRNRFLDFTSKEGLLSCVEHSHWNYIDGVASIFTPKTHRLSTREDQQDFENDFKLTQCLSLLNYICEGKTPEDSYDAMGSVSLQNIDFAIKQIERAITIKKNEDIDYSEADMINRTDSEWRRFMEDCDKIINQRMKFIASQMEQTNYNMRIRKILYEARQYWPTINMDGYSNIWILKPANKSRGIGIVLMIDWWKITTYARKNCHLRYIIQKYIERPLLIYKTKFDIRQYILITMTDTINIWMYKDCYLRFSSQEFKLCDLREAVHITNNSVQRKYNNGTTRSELLPAHNMWSLIEFQNYLTSIDKEHAWSDSIYPKMKENIITIILSSLEMTDFATNSFELYGCDFMITEDYKPVLIEINSTPDMSPSTVVTGRICPQVLDDLIKVVVDLPRNPAASTGDFEMVYKVPWTKVPSYSRGLVVHGSGLKFTTMRKSLADKNRYNTSKKLEVLKEIPLIQIPKRQSSVCRRKSKSRETEMKCRLVI